MNWFPFENSCFVGIYWQNHKKVTVNNSGMNFLEVEVDFFIKILWKRLFFDKLNYRAYTKKIIPVWNKKTHDWEKNIYDIL